MFIEIKERQIEALVDEILDIADDGSQDYIVNKDGKVVANIEHIHRARLRIDTRKWLAAKLCPRLYGDKVVDAKSSAGETLLEKLMGKL